MKTFIITVFSVMLFLSCSSNQSKQKESEPENLPEVSDSVSAQCAAEKMVMEEAAPLIAEKIVMLKMLKMEWERLSTVAERKQFLDIHGEEIEDLGYEASLDNVENMLVTNFDALTNAVTHRIKAAVAKDLAIEAQEEALLNGE